MRGHFLWNEEFLVDLYTPMVFLSGWPHLLSFLGMIYKERLQVLSCIFIPVRTEGWKSISNESECIRKSP